MPDKPKPHWRLSFDISPDLVMGQDGKPCQKATATAQHGEFGYLAEIRLQDWPRDIAAFFEQVRNVFFQAETNGLPTFPDMSQVYTPTNTAEPAQPPQTVEPGNALDNPGSDEAGLDRESPAEEEADYDITFYPAADGAGPAQPDLF
jgi:hypothetical protein